MSVERVIPYGFCHCGCGELAPISPVNHARMGYVKGEPRRFRVGHRARLQPDAEARFWANTEKAGPEECWVWRGTLSSDGYASMSLNRKKTRAHRFAYELLVGVIPEGLTLDHLCLNKVCVNPAHLEPVTFGENARRYQVQKAA